MERIMTRRASLAIILVVASAMAAADAHAQFGSLFGSKAEVTEISVDQLQKLKLHEEKQDSPYVLVDVRSEEESAVSLIPGAITKADFEKQRERYAGRTVIAYCTSGYRSERYARELMEQDVKVMNFKGSILGWCRSGLPLVTPEKEPTNRVHTYSSRNRVPAKYEAVW